ncbi:MAG: amino acid deaminase/aldolase [Chitinophagales bacterium]
MKQPTYAYYKQIFSGKEMPFAFIDIDLLKQNIIQSKLRAGTKNIRIASKSIRCVAVMKYILDMGLPFQGIMAFTALEAIFLAKKGFNDLLVAYPTWHKNHVSAVCEAIKADENLNVFLMLDSEEHVNHLAKIATENEVVLPVCLDLDMSSDFSKLHFGVYRSSVTNKKQAKKVVKAIEANPSLRLAGVMGYEAQIAGVGDNVKGDFLKNQVVRQLKKRSIKEIAKRRAEVVKMIEKRGHQLDFVNGGGTGSLETTKLEDCVTEVTVGSGFYASGLFDNYVNFKHAPAAAYAIEIVRKPQANIYTCSGGGYTASGTAGNDKTPVPYLPKGISLTANEGAGEVQTPIVYKGQMSLQLGDPIFLRHSKAGELCERFNELWIVGNGKIIEKVPTYRGEGKCFL